MTLEQLKNLRDSNVEGVNLVSHTSSVEAHGSLAVHRGFSIDLNIPKLLFCRSKSIDALINQNVSRYLSFSSVKSLFVRMLDGSELTIPTTRGSIFQDKGLKLNEKRALMNLFKLAGETSSSAVTSAAYSCSNSVRVTDVNKSDRAIDFLKHNAKIERPELISGIIHGACLYPHPGESMTVGDLLDRLSKFLISLNQYEEGAPFLVPMYGNSDIPQAFARTAAVHGALYILSCDETQLWAELQTKSSVVPQKLSCESRSDSHAYHGIACFKNKDGDSMDASLHVFHPTTLNDSPVYALSLPCKGGIGGGPQMCPEGHTLVHFIKLTESTQPNLLKEEMMSFLSERDVMFETILSLDSIVTDPFSLDTEFEEARMTFNKVMKIASNEPLPHPPTPAVVPDQDDV
jgi:RAB protein geranylgeranyltransferase component A